MITAYSKWAGICLYNSAFTNWVQFYLVNFTSTNLTITKWLIFNHDQQPLSMCLLSICCCPILTPWQQWMIGFFFFWPGCAIKQLMWFLGWVVRQWTRASEIGWVATSSCCRGDVLPWQKDLSRIIKISHLKARHTASQWYDPGRFPKQWGLVWAFWQITKFVDMVSRHPAEPTSKCLALIVDHLLAAPAEHKINLCQMQSGLAGRLRG